MRYYSLNDKKENKDMVSFREAMIKGLAPDRGLYFPSEIPKLDPDFLNNLDTYSDNEIAFRAIKPFINNEIPETELRKIVSETLNFSIPVVPVKDNYSTLELFHGPTMAFKDVGARFMARCLGFFNRGKEQATIRVLVATSGDTGGAVANGFLGVPGVEVIILYPKDKVSDIQERQLTTLGKNIHALRVSGSFDDCQNMVKSAFLDPETQELNLTSANSINIARWLPQMFYYFLAKKQVMSSGRKKKLIFAVPSGNFGNICAGMMASAMGLEVEHFVAATNINDTVPRYLESEAYAPEPTRPTISNAMDVSDPSNFVRIEKLFNNSLPLLKKQFSSCSFTDEQTREAMKKLYTSSGYIADPHGAVGFLGAKKAMTEKSDVHAIFLETAHPVKFREEVERTLGLTLELPPQIQEVMEHPKSFTSISDYKELKDFLMNT
ncbi:threonine synthase [Robertkochia flava]|uniref:threonine synthase n=1 Tax=Robertkochia flava TaxID=3447986 RepID=UPI001CCFF04F|nr:threonine synthase [Robertkochia marina]